MKKHVWKKTLTLALALGLALGATGCIQVYTSPEGSAAAPAAEAPVSAPTVAQQAATAPAILPAGGTLLLKVNPEIAVSYDGQGKATAVTAVNPDAEGILNGYTGYRGKDCSAVVEELVGRIDQAGYFVEEIEGTPRQIIIEVEQGSHMPSEDFLNGIVDRVEVYVQNRQMANSVSVQSANAPAAQPGQPTAPAYGAGSYGDTLSPAPGAPQGSTRIPVGGMTDYGTTDYGTTDYGTTDYGKTVYDSNSGYSSYESNSGYSSYDSNSGYSSYGNSGYSSYGNSGYSGYSGYDD